MKMRSIFLFVSLVALSSALKSYEGYKSKRCFFENEEERERVYSMCNLHLIEIIGDFVESVDLLVSKEQLQFFEKSNDDNKDNNNNNNNKDNNDSNTNILLSNCITLVEDVQKQLEFEDIRLENSRKEVYSNDSYDPDATYLGDSDPFHKTYHSYKEIMNKLQEIASKYPKVAKLSTMGKTGEGRDLPVVRLSGTSTTTKQTVFIMAGIHAREWISPATAVYIIQLLSEKYGVDSKITNLLNSVEVVIAPITNPDGYAYSWSNDRMWRKNRNDNNGNSCKGVDLNRNFDVFWGTQSSNNRCAHDYHGTGAASEPEVRAIQKLVSSLSKRIGAIDIHSYGQYIMRPYGYTNTKHPKEQILSVLGSEIVQLIKAKTGASYSSIRSAELYPVSGASDDWFTVKLGLWGYCFELRDKGSTGFRLPESNILPTGKEIYAAVVHYIEFVKKNFN